MGYDRATPSGGENHASLFGEGFSWVIVVAIVSVQNSNAPPLMMKFLTWKFETSLVYTVFGAIVSGIFLTLSVWMRKAIHASIRKKELPREPPPAWANTLGQE